MRKALYAAFLLGTTALYPTKAMAQPPVIGFIGGLISVIAPATGLGLVGAGGVGGFLLGSSVGVGLASFFGTTIGGLLLNTALSLGISALAAALRPRPPVATPAVRMANIRQPITFFETVYGRVRKGGPVYFWQAKQGRRYYGVIIAAHAISAVLGHFADEREITLDGSGYPTQAVYTIDGLPRFQVASYLGTPGQSSPPLLKDNFAEWTDAHDMAGFAHAVCVATNTPSESYSTVFPTGREPVYTELVEGKPIYDPRVGAQDPADPETWAYSANAALVIADWIVSSDGLGRQVNWDKVAIEADAAAAELEDRDGNTIAKWQLSGVFSSADPRETVRASLGVAADAFFYEDTDGTVGFHVGRYMAPTVTISDGDILSATYAEGQAGTDIKSAFSVEYLEAEIGYREAASAAYVIEAADEAYEEDSLQAFSVPNHNQAVRVSKRMLKASRAKYRASLLLKYHGVRLMAQRFFRLTHAEAGIDAVFEVDKLSRNDDRITWTVEAHSVEAADFDFDAATEEPQKPDRSTIVTSSDIPEPAGVTASVEVVAGVPTILVDWDDPPRDSLLNQVRYRLAGEDDWFVVSVPSRQSYQRLVGLADGEDYDIQVRALAATGSASKWVPNNGGDENDPALTVTVVVDTVPPPDLVDFDIVGGPEFVGHVAMTFTTPIDAHLRHIAVYAVPSGGVLDTDDPSQFLVRLSGVPTGSTFGHTHGDSTISPQISNDMASSAGWFLGTGLAIGSGVMTATAGTSSAASRTPAAFSAGDVWRSAIDATLSAGSYQMRLGGGTVQLSTPAISTSGRGLGSVTAITGNTSVGILKDASLAGTFDNFLAYIETPACAPQGHFDLYAVPENGSFVEGDPFGPVAVTII